MKILAKSLLSGLARNLLQPSTQESTISVSTLSFQVARNLAVVLMVDVSLIGRCCIISSIIFCHLVYMQRNPAYPLVVILPNFLIQKFILHKELCLIASQQVIHSTCIYVNLIRTLCVIPCPPPVHQVQLHSMLLQPYSLPWSAAINFD